MKEVILSKDAVHEAISWTREDQKIFDECCIEAYVLYPKSGANYIRDAITKIYRMVTYGVADDIEASADIGSYVDEGLLTADLISNHKNITRLILPHINGLINGIVFKGFNKDTIAFDVDCC